MESRQEASSPGEGVHDKPCRTCRQRKVRCSKRVPCSNCQRVGIECVYDEPSRSSIRGPKTTAALAERVTELESLVTSLSDQLAAKEESVPDQSRRLGPANLDSSVFETQRIANRLLSEAPQATANSIASVQGRLVSDNGSSRHLLNAFWASMYDEIDSLKFVLREAQPSASPLSWLHGVDGRNSGSNYTHLSPTQSDFLIQAFVSNVDPFVRILHKPTLLKKLNHFRRGVLPDFQDFQYQLAAIYGLALLSLSTEDCQLYLGEPREMLVTRFRSQIEDGLGILKITTTHKLSSLQTLILHISCLIWTGEILHASSLLGLAVRTAQRLGVHRDGTHFNLSPWNIELRRRLWHQILLIDTWCIEHHGLESAISDNFSDVRLPQNSNDSAWDISDSSTLQPSAQSGFTDMTFALLQFELAALIRIVLRHSVSLIGSEKAYLNFHSQLRRETWHCIEQTFLQRLDGSDLRQTLVLDSAKLTFERIRLAQLQPLMRSRYPHQTISADLEMKLLESAVNYCQHVQDTQLKYASRRLDWVIMRAFCWHSLAIMLSTVLRNHAISNTPEAKYARERIAKVFVDRPSIDHLKGNDTLWEPLERLKSELLLRQFVNVDVENQHNWQDEMAGLHESWGDALASMSDVLD